MTKPTFEEILAEELRKRGMTKYDNPKRYLEARFAHEAAESRYRREKEMQESNE